MHLATPDPAPPLQTLCCNVSHIWLAVGEVQLRDGRDSNLARDATESREDPAPVALALTEQMRIGASVVPASHLWRSSLSAFFYSQRW